MGGKKNSEVADKGQNVFMHTLSRTTFSNPPENSHGKDAVAAAATVAGILSKALRCLCP